MSSIPVGPDTVSTGLQVAVAPRAGDAAVVMWAAGGGGVHLTQVDAAGARAADDIVVPGMSGHGVAVTPRGFSVLVRRAPGGNLTDEMWLVEVSPAGTVLLEVRLIGGNDNTVVGNEWVDAFTRRGRLAWTGTAHVAYFTIQRRWPDNIAHQGDTLRLLDANGAPLTGGWGWGCSHSLDVRLEWNGTRTAPICLSDCYPAKGIFFNHDRTEISSEPSGNCMGFSSARLGGLAPDPLGFWFTYTSTETRASQDVGLVHLDNAGAVDARTWLTADSVAQSASVLATLGTELLVGWREGGGVRMQRLSTAGVPLGAVETVTNAQWGDGNDMITLSSGDAAWAHAWGTFSELKFVRVRRCQ